VTSHLTPPEPELSIRRLLQTLARARVFLLVGSYITFPDHQPPASGSVLPSPASPPAPVFTTGQQQDGNGSGVHCNSNPSQQGIRMGDEKEQLLMLLLEEALRESLTNSIRLTANLG